MCESSGPAMAGVSNRSISVVSERNASDCKVEQSEFEQSCPKNAHVIVA
jgi:hypothetical protein